MKMSQLKKKYIVATLVCTILCYAGSVCKMVSPQSRRARGRGEEDLYFSLSSPLSCEVLKPLWNLNLLTLWSAIARQWWQEGSDGDNQHTLQQYWPCWQGEAPLCWTSHCRGELAAAAKGLEYERHGKLPSIVMKYTCSLQYKKPGNKLFIFFKWILILN